MSKLLLNGCSYAHRWAHEWYTTGNISALAQRLGYDETVSLAVSGSSNARIFRTTLEYLTLNPDVDFVVIALTFYNRFEAPWASPRPIEGRWVSYSHNGVTNRESDEHLVYERPEIKRYIDDRYRYDLGVEYIDALLADLIFFTGWLDAQGYKYCIINPCERLYADDKGMFDTAKMRWIRENPKIVDIENFIANKWMHEQGAVCPEDETNLDPMYRHYGNDGFTMLNEFMYNYITKNCL